MMLGMAMLMSWWEYEHVDDGNGDDSEDAYNAHSDEKYEKDEN